MPRLLIALSVLLGIAIGVAATLYVRPAPGVDEVQVRSIVAEVIAEQAAEAAVIVAEPPPMDLAVLGPAIDDHLLTNPRILQRMSDALDAELRAEQLAATRAALAEYKDEIFNDPDGVVVGNPNGDVTLVEMFDYNCSYCRSSLPDLVQLVADDPNLRVVLKEFPILSQQSVDAARVAVLVAEQPVDYWSFHQKLFTARGQVTGAVALAAAKDLGLNTVPLELEMDSARVNGTIQKTYDIAKALNISGTPTFIIGDEVIPGAVPLEQLKTRIANMRACGKTQCEGNG